MRRFASLAAAALGVLLALAAPAGAADAAGEGAKGAPPASAPAQDAQPSPAVAEGVQSAREAAAAAARAGFEIRVLNRVIATLRAKIYDTTPQERAEAASARLKQILDEAGDGKVEVKTIPQGRVITLDGKLAFLLLPGDVNASAGETLDAAAKAAAFELRRVAAETQESRDLNTILRSVLRAAVATAIAAVLFWALLRIRGWIARGLVSLMNRQTGRLQVGGQSILHRETVFRIARGITSIFFWLAAAIVVYEWLAYVFSLFPWTRPWGEGLLSATLNLAKRILTGILNSLPNLAVAGTIFLFATWITRLVGRILEPFIRGEVETAHIDRDTARPTRNLITIGVWVFAIAMAYPYLPGAESEAFKGLSVLVGVMISLGSTSVVGQAASGLIVMYARLLRPGEYVRIGDHEGTVVELGALTTRIRTGMGEEVTISNSTIASGTTKNYSRGLQGDGFIVDTVVTIGYDTPWRQVHAMLAEAARRTQGVVADPPPAVFQTGLSDFYPEYRVVAQAIPTEPRPRAVVISELHANIQDVFNEHGVQIMSPHYLGDPAEAKVVPPAKWYAAPAKKPD